jgi:hypothetical protein
MIEIGPSRICTVALRRCLDRDPQGHEAQTHRALARRIAGLLEADYANDPADDCAQGAECYFVPDRTLVAEEADALGIRGEADLFGGVVPYAFVATKTISHGLVDAAATAPDGWSHALGKALGDAVLPGYSVYSRDDLLRAGRALLAGGPVRVKAAHQAGGNGQRVVAHGRELADHAATLTDAMLRRYGAVVERDLVEATTYSIGQARIGAHAIAYFGTQRQTVDHRGLAVYGGSDLTVVRGRFDDLLTHALPDEMQRAIEQVRHYDAEVIRAYPDICVTRCNYDVVAGLDRDGRRWSGVLEQSWRIGGASAAEIAAIEALQAEPSRALVRASTYETYTGEVPDGAEVHFRGRDGQVGSLVKYSLVHPQ